MLDAIGFVIGSAHIEWQTVLVNKHFAKHRIHVLAGQRHRGFEVQLVGDSLFAASKQGFYPALGVIQRFVDIGVADGVVMEGNTLVAVPGWGAPTDGAICIYGSLGFNSTIIAELNTCYNETAPIACGFCVPPA